MSHVCVLFFYLNSGNPCVIKNDHSLNARCCLEPVRPVCMVQHLTADQQAFASTMDTGHCNFAKQPSGLLHRCLGIAGVKGEFCRFWCWCQAHFHWQWPSWNMLHFPVFRWEIQFSSPEVLIINENITNHFSSWDWQAKYNWIQSPRIMTLFL